MKKYIFLISILTTFLNADSFYMGRCVKSYTSTYDGTNHILRVNFSSGAYYTMNYSKPDLENELSKLVKFENKFTYSEIKEGRNTTEICSSLTSNNILGLPETEYNFLLAIYGIFLSSLIAFGLIKAF